MTKILSSYAVHTAAKNAESSSRPLTLNVHWTSLHPLCEGGGGVAKRTKAVCSKLFALTSWGSSLMVRLPINRDNTSDRTSLKAGGDAPINRHASTCVPGQAYAQ